jgi:hypothetical protein
VHGAQSREWEYTLTSQNQTTRQKPSRQQWQSEKPTPPESPRPILAHLKERSGILLVVLALSVIAGFVVIGFGIRGDDGVQIVVGVIGVFAFPMLTFVFVAITTATIESILASRHRQLLRRTGWHDFDIAQKVWELIGDEYFTDTTESRKPTKPWQPLVTGDAEFDAFESALAAATPGPRSALLLPSSREVAQKAREARKLKARLMDEELTFMWELRFIATRPLSLNSAGMYASSAADAEDKARIEALISPVLAQQGLEYIRYGTTFAGMFDGPRGAWETMHIVVRVA